MDASHIKAMRAALAAQETTYDEGGLRLYVTRREARVDVAFRTVNRDGAELHPDMEPLWLLTALVAPDGLRMVQQEMGSGEDDTQFFPSLARHLDANPVPLVTEPTDTRYLSVGAYHLRARRFNRGWAESVRVDLRVTWKGGGPEAWMHAFDAELKGHPLGGAPSLHVTAESEVLSPQWGQVEHLARFAAYAALATTAASDVAMRRIGGLVAWGVDESVFAATGGE